MSEGQLGRARIKMRQELIINCDPREDPGDQVLTNTYWNAQLGMCYCFISPLEVKIAACVAAGQNCFGFSLLSSHLDLNKIGKLTLG